MAHALSASTEGELGLFGGDHGSVRYTDPDEAERYVAESGADTLAVSVGSEHHQRAGSSSRASRTSRRAQGTRSCLHGGSGIHPDDVREAVAMGVVKINIGHAISSAMTEGARESLARGLDHYGMLKVMREKVRERRRREDPADGRGRGASGSTPGSLRSPAVSTLPASRSALSRLLVASLARPSGPRSWRVALGPTVVGRLPAPGAESLVRVEYPCREMWG